MNFLNLQMNLQEFKALTADLDVFQTRLQTNLLLIKTIHSGNVLNPKQANIEFTIFRRFPLFFIFQKFSCFGTMEQQTLGGEDQCDLKQIF